MAISRATPRPRPEERPRVGTVEKKYAELAVGRLDLGLDRSLRRAAHSVSMGPALRERPRDEPSMAPFQRRCSSLVTWVLCDDFDSADPGVEVRLPRAAENAPPRVRR
jgi:hypothetical protein